MSAVHPNVDRALRAAGVRYAVRRHVDCAQPILRPDDFAAALGYDVARIAKTILVRTLDGSRYACAVLSANQRVDVKAVGGILGRSRIELAATDEVLARTGYPRTGVSPLGLGEDIPVIIDEGLYRHLTVLVGAGDVGVELEIAPADLQNASNGTVAPISR